MRNGARASCRLLEKCAVKLYCRETLRNRHESRHRRHRAHLVSTSDARLFHARIEARVAVSASQPSGNRSEEGVTFSGRPVRLGRRRFSLGPYRRWKVKVLAALEETFKLREKSVFHRIFRRVGYQLGDARISRHQALHRRHGRQHLLDRALRTASDEWIGLGLERLLDRLRKERTQPRRQRSRSFRRSVPRAHANALRGERRRDLRATHTSGDADDGHADENSNPFALLQVSF